LINYILYFDFVFSKYVVSIELYATLVLDDLIPIAPMVREISRIYFFSLRSSGEETKSSRMVFDDIFQLFIIIFLDDFADDVFDILLDILLWTVDLLNEVILLALTFL